MLLVCCLHQESLFCTSSVCVCVCVCVRPSVCPSVCYQLISGAVGPIAAKLCTHIHWQAIQNLYPTFLKGGPSSATMRLILPIDVLGQYSYRFQPKITQLGTQYLYSLVIDMRPHVSHSPVVAPP